MGVRANASGLIVLLGKIASHPFALYCLYGSSDKISEIGMWRMRVRFLEEEGKCSLPSLLYADDLLLGAE